MFSKGDNRAGWRKSLTVLQKGGKLPIGNKGFKREQGYVPREAVITDPTDTVVVEEAANTIQDSLQP